MKQISSDDLMVLAGQLPNGLYRYVNKMIVSAKIVAYVRRFREHEGLSVEKAVEKTVERLMDEGVELNYEAVYQRYYRMLA